MQKFCRATFYHCFPLKKHTVSDEESCEASLLPSRILIFKKKHMDIKIENYHGSNKKNGTIKVQWCRTCWWTRAAVPVTGGPFFSGQPPRRGSYVPGGNRKGCHRGGNRTCLQAWVTISGEHRVALTPPPEVTSVSSGREEAGLQSCGRAGQDIQQSVAFLLHKPPALII